MPIVVKCHGSASGRPMSVEGKYLKAYNLEAFGGEGACVFTAQLDQALRFADLAAFHQVYSSSPASRPTRPDGKPNRPLTATHWELITVPA